MSSNHLQELQLLQQNLQNNLLQKQQIQNQLLELESALKEIQTTDKAYKIVGKIMIASSKEELIKDLQDKKEVAELRLKNFTQQEKRIQENIEKLQKEVLKEMQPKSK